MPLRGLIPIEWPRRQAVDQGMDQLLLQPVRRLAVSEQSSPDFGNTDAGLMELAQLPASC